LICCAAILLPGIPFTALPDHQKMRFILPAGRPVPRSGKRRRIVNVSGINPFVLEILSPMR
jgi:hypothetical protein